MKISKIEYVVMLIISIVMTFFYASVWTNETTTSSDKFFLTGLVGAIHFFALISGYALSKCI